MLKITTTLIMLGLSVMSSTTWANDTFYKWVDANGTTHYTQTPPPKGSKSLGNVKTYNDYVSTPVPAPQPSTSSEQSTSNNTTMNDSEPSQPTSVPTPTKPNTQYIPLPK